MRVAPQALKPVLGEVHRGSELPCRMVFYNLEELDSKDLLRAVEKISVDWAEKIPAVNPTRRKQLNTDFKEAAGIIVQLQTTIGDAYNKKLKGNHKLAQLARIDRREKPQFSLRSIQAILNHMKNLVENNYTVQQALEKALINRFVLGAPEAYISKADGGQKNHQLIRTYITEILHSDAKNLQSEGKSEKERRSTRRKLVGYPRDR